MISTPEIAWVAGLLEGEGTFGMYDRAICISINMIDRDIIERVGALLGGRVYGPYARGSERHKPIWRAQLKGPGAAAWMMTIYSWLGRRRREQVETALRQWRMLKYVRISPRTERSIVEAWDAGARVKVQLGHEFGISRETVYRVLFENHRIERLRESYAPITPSEVAWLAGLVEGEGNISINGRSLTLRIKMGDHDVISHAASLLGAKVQAATVSDPRGKPMWLAQIKSSTAAEWIMTLYSWLGIRRQQQARDALLAWRRQGHGVIPQSLTEAILGCRRARLSQSEIIALLKVSKSTVYRHTKNKVRRMRVVSPRRRDGEVREHQLRYGSA